MKEGLKGGTIRITPFERTNYVENISNKGQLINSGKFVYNAGVSFVNGFIGLFNYAGELDDSSDSFSKLSNDVSSVYSGVSSYISNTTPTQAGIDFRNTFSRVETWENIVGAKFGVKGIKFKYDGNINIGKNIQFSLMSKTTAPGMSGYRVLGLKINKFQAAIDRHNWVLRKPNQSPINQKFWHYHWGRGKTGGHHRQFGTGEKIMSPSDLRSGILGDY